MGPVVNQQWLKNSPSDCQIGKPRCVFLPPSESTISPSSDAQWTSLSFQPSHCMADTCTPLPPQTHYDKVSAFAETSISQHFLNFLLINILIQTFSAN